VAPHLNVWLYNITQGCKNSQTTHLWTFVTMNIRSKWTANYRVVVVLYWAVPSLITYPALSCAVRVDTLYLCISMVPLSSMVRKNTHKQAICTNSTDYSINSHSKYNYLSKMVQKPLLSLSEKQAHKNPQNIGYTAPMNGDFCLYILTCILYHAVTKSLLCKFRLGSTKYICQLIG